MRRAMKWMADICGAAVAYSRSPDFPHANSNLRLLQSQTFSQLLRLVRNACLPTVIGPDRDKLAGLLWIRQSVPPAMKLLKLESISASGPCSHTALQQCRQSHLRHRSRGQQAQWQPRRRAPGISCSSTDSQQPGVVFTLSIQV